MEYVKDFFFDDLIVKEILKINFDLKILIVGYGCFFFYFGNIIVVFEGIIEKKLCVNG